MKDDKYTYLYSVENVNKLVKKGMSFRDAYKQVGQEIEEGTYKPNTHFKHSHEGSIGNLCNAEIVEKFNQAYL